MLNDIAETLGAQPWWLKGALIVLAGILAYYGSYFFFRVFPM